MQKSKPPPLTWGRVHQVLSFDRSAERGNSTGLLGVDVKQGKNRAQIVVAGKKIHLGYFAKPEDAHQAYLVAKRSLHEGNTL